jgi:hypothetical protein
MLKKGPQESLVVFELQQLIKKFLETWSGDDSFENNISSDLIAQELFPKIEEQIRERSDEIIKKELDNYYLTLNINRKKERKNKKKKKGAKKKKIPGENLVHTDNPIDLLPSVIETNILTTNKPVTFNDFVGEFNYIRNLMEESSPFIPDPSLQQLKNCIMLEIAIPLGLGFFIENLTVNTDTYNKQKFKHITQNPSPIDPLEESQSLFDKKKEKTVPNNKCFLFYGPRGTGKQLMVDILAHETNSLLFTLDSDLMSEYFIDKTAITRILFIIFKLAKNLQPAIIHIKDIENWFPKKSTKKNKVPAGKCIKFKKDLLMQINKHLERNDKVVVIGTTSKPFYMNLAEAKKLFFKKFYFPFPDYSSRIKLLKYFIVEYR